MALAACGDREKTNGRYAAETPSVKLIKNGTVANPAVDRVFDFPIGGQRFTGVKRIWKQSAIIQTIPPKHRTPHFRRNPYIEVRENSSSAVGRIEIG